jgi:hypothetical protein
MLLRKIFDFDKVDLIRLIKLLKTWRNMLVGKVKEDISLPLEQENKAMKLCINLCKELKSNEFPLDYILAVYKTLAKDQELLQNFMSLSRYNQASVFKLVGRYRPEAISAYVMALKTVRTKRDVILTGEFPSVYLWYVKSFGLFKGSRLHSKNTKNFSYRALRFKSWSRLCRLDPSNDFYYPMNGTKTIDSELIHTTVLLLSVAYGRNLVLSQMEEWTSSLSMNNGTIADFAKKLEES